MSMLPVSDPAPEPTAGPRRSSIRVRFGVAFLIGILVTLGLGAGAMYAYDQQYVGRVLPGVSVAGVNLSGMTDTEARATINSAFGAYADGRILIEGPDGSTTITYAEIGRRFDTDAVVQEAFAVGRTGTPVERAVTSARIALRGVDLAPRITFDAQILDDRIQAIADGLLIEPAEAFVVHDEAVDFLVVGGHDGRTIDPSAAIGSISKDLARLDAPAELNATLPVTVVEPTVSTAEATTAAAAAQRITAKITLVVDKTKVALDASRIRPWVTFKVTDDGGYEPMIDTADLPSLLKGLGKKINLKPVNASFRTKGTTVTGVTPSKDGYKLDSAGTIKQLESLLAARAVGTTSTDIRPAVVVREPLLTTAEAKAAAPRMKRISSWTTYFPIYEGNNFGANIWLPALAIDGTVVAPGAKFDFWDAVGPVSYDQGYGLGGAIIDGKTETQGALAGGICSCSTTLFNAALRAGLDMGARRNHFYYIDRYPIGLDATVFKSDGGSVQTMSFTNDTKYPILIRGYQIKSGSSGYVRFVLYSVPNGRRVTISDPIVKNVLPASDTVQYTTSLRPGVVQRVEYPVDGKQVWRTVTVRDRNGKIIHKTTYYSNYSRITGLTLIGKGS
jgi:vancomycin resistance protein YoaR